MFSCHHFPAADPDWLKLVRREARQQLRRLSSHACIALWCGDNELIGALDWFETTRKNRDRYLANYVMLNHALEEEVAGEAVDVPFWPSSPSSGRLNYGDAWHDDRSGDMHFWEVWHGAKDFSHYFTVRPRFCSEFGFQSFPSPATIARFTEPADRNVSSPVMDLHQRNPGGNARIVETISRNFRFPGGFDELVFLSQVGQGLAMKTAVEYWRSLKPHCMGTLYWQLNDTWPGPSWSSVEHGGAWKLCHALARRFFDPVLVTARADGDHVAISAVCDAPDGVTLEVELTRWTFGGERQALAAETVAVPHDRAVGVARLPVSALGDDGFLQIGWRSGDGAHRGANSFVPRPWKGHELGQPAIVARWIDDQELELATDVPAFFVTLGWGGTTAWSDNAFTLLPGQPKRVRPVIGTADPSRLPDIWHVARASG